MNWSSKSDPPKRRVYSFPVFQGADTDFSIDMDDYTVVHEILSSSRITGKKTKLQRMVSIREDDEDRRVCKLRMPDLDNVPSLPASIGRLSHLTHLLLGKNCSTMTTLPSSIGELKNLTHLVLRSCGISYLPRSIGKLLNLKVLDLSYTSNLQTLPQEIRDLTSLKRLDLRHSTVTCPPPSVDHLKMMIMGSPSVAWVKLRWAFPMLPTKFFSIFENVVLAGSELHNLDSLIISGATITLLPASIGNLQNLKVLDLSSTRYLLRLPEQIGDLHNLRRMNLSQSAIDSVPSTFKRLQNLTDLNLSKASNFQECSLTEIWNLTNLKVLDLSHMSITSLPEPTGKLRHLVYLNLSGTPIVDLKGEKPYKFLLMLIKCYPSLESLGDSTEGIDKSLLIHVNKRDIKWPAPKDTPKLLYEVIKFAYSLERDCRDILGSAYGKRRIREKLKDICNEEKKKLDFALLCNKTWASKLTMTKLWPHKLKRLLHAFERTPNCLDPQRLEECDIIHQFLLRTICCAPNYFQSVGPRHNRNEGAIFCRHSFNIMISDQVCMKCHNEVRVSV